MPREGNSGSFGLVMAILQRPLKTRTCSLSSLRGIFLKYWAILALLTEGSVSDMMQKKHEQLVHVGVAGSKLLLVLVVEICGIWDSMVDRNKLESFV